MQRLQAAEVKLHLDGGKLKVRVPKGKQVPAELLQDIRVNKESIMTYLAQQARDALYTLIPNSGTQEYYAVVFQQQSMWMRYWYQKQDRIPFNMGEYVSLPSADPIMIEKVFRTLMQRHEVLRTSFHHRDHRCYQKVHSVEELTFSLQSVDVSASEDPEKAAADARQQALNTMFDLSVAPLIHVVSIKIAEDQYCVQYTIPHFIGDAWSKNLLMAEIQTIYTALASGQKDERPPLTIQNRDYSEWYDTMLASDEGQRLKTYWDNKLQGTACIHQLQNLYRPEAGKRLTRYQEALAVEVKENFKPLTEEEYEKSCIGIISSAKTYPGEGYKVVLEVDTYNRLIDMAAEAETSLYNLFLGGLSIGLATAAGLDEVLLGNVVVMRDHKGTNDLIGNLCNTLLLHTQPSPGKTFQEFLKEIGTEVLEASDHKFYPFESILESCDVSLEALGTVFFNYLSFGDRTGRLVETKEPVFYPEAYPYFNLDVTLRGYEDGLEITLVYKKELFQKETMIGLTDALCDTLRQIASGGIDQDLGQLRAGITFTTSGA